MKTNLEGSNVVNDLQIQQEREWVSYWRFQRGSHTTSVPSKSSTYLLDSADFGSLFFRDFAVELFFNSHDKFDSVQRVSTKVINEGGRRDNLVGINTKLRNNDVLDLVFNITSHEEGRGGTATNKGRRGESGGASGKGGNNNLTEHLCN